MCVCVCVCVCACVCVCTCEVGRDKRRGIGKLCFNQFLRLQVTKLLIGNPSNILPICVKEITSNILPICVKEISINRT